MADVSSIEELPSFGDYAKDLPPSVGIGLVKGGINAAGGMGDLRHDGLSAATDYLGQKLGASPETIQAFKNRAYNLAGLTTWGQVARDAPTSADIQKGIESQTGQFYAPKTDMGQMAESAASRWPLAFVPEARAPSAVQKIIQVLKSR
jgi:hypothetical protein